MRTLAAFLIVIPVLACLAHGAAAAAQRSEAPHARLPDDMPLDAVKWLGGFWQDRMQRLRDIYLPGVLDGSFMSVENGATFRNLLRAAGLEKGGALGHTWGDGDCFLVLDVAARLYAHHPDDYLKGKLDYWIPIIAKMQQKDGRVDSWSLLGLDPEHGKRWLRIGGYSSRGRTKGNFHYNFGALHAAASAHRKATGEDRFTAIADRAVFHYLKSGRAAICQMQWAIAPLYARTGDQRCVDALKRAYGKWSSPFGPPFRLAPEIFGHNTYTANFLMGAAALYGITGEQALLDALKRLTANLLSKKVFVTGAVAPVRRGQRPEQIVKGKKYPAGKMHEAVGEAYDLPNDQAYNEACGQCLYMEWLYRMFRATGEAVYMDAAERALYNTVPGCVDLEKPNFFYCNPQEQSPASERCRTDGLYVLKRSHYTWKRLHTKRCACCPPKVMRAIAMSVEMAYSVNREGLWVNLYGDNTARMALPDGGELECRQTSAYPWDGNVQLVLRKVESTRPFDLFLRIPGWADGPVRIAVNRMPVEKREMGGTYHRIQRQWKSGDVVDLELPMAVRFVAAHPNVADARGKVAVARGPVVYCLEGDDVPEGVAIEDVRVPSWAQLEPVFTSDLGGVVKLSGQLVHSTTAPVSAGRLTWPEGETALYRRARFAEGGGTPAPADRHVTVSLIPYYARLNRASDYFRIWLPVY